MTDAVPAVRSCEQLVSDDDDCCSGSNGVCASAAVWEHGGAGVALCDLHMTNAERFGGRQFGYWYVGKTRVSYPQGWTRIADGDVLLAAPTSETRSHARS